MATHSSVLAWRIPGTGEPGGLPSMGSRRVGHDRSDSAAAACYQWLSQGRGSDSKVLSTIDPGWSHVEGHSDVRTEAAGALGVGARGEGRSGPLLSAGGANLTRIVGALM